MNAFHIIYVINYKIRQFSFLKTVPAKSAVVAGGGGVVLDEVLQILRCNSA